MSSNLQNSIWPNAGGTLGQNKVQMPTGTANDPWPTGDALVNYFVFNKGKLVGFVDTKALIANTSKSTTFPYEYVNISLPSIAEGEMTYNHDQCAYFILNGEVLKGDIPTDGELEIITKKYIGCLTVDDIKAVDPDYLTNDIVNGVWKEGLADLTDGNSMFYNCTNLSLFTSDLPSLTHAYSMFACSALTSFSSDLSSLTNGDYMFYGCTALSLFTSDLPSLTNGRDMFTYCELSSFSSELPSLTHGYSMFAYSNLSSFSSDLSSLTNGGYMFYGCTNLTSFSSDLSSLTYCEAMFEDCKLDTASVQNIADTINTCNGTIHIGIGNSTPNTEETTAFNKMVSKGWNVYVNGSWDAYVPATASLNETGQEITTPIPFWAKPINSDEQNAQYIDSEGNFYNILGAQFIYGDNLETYGMFTSLEDAVAQMGLTKIEK